MRMRRRGETDWRVIMWLAIISINLSCMTGVLTGINYSIQEQTEVLRGEEEECESTKLKSGRTTGR